MPHHHATEPSTPLRDRFDFQAGMLAGYLAESLPQHRVRQAVILLENLVRTGHQTLNPALEDQPEMHRVAVEHAVR